MSIQDSSGYGQVEAAAHEATLRLLAEVADYLSRLPAHPMTHAMIQKVQSHLDDPKAKVLNARLAMLADDQIQSAKVRSGDGFKGTSELTTLGAPVIAARLLYPELRLESPAVKQYLEAGELSEAESLADAIGRQIADGISIQLTPIDPIFARVWIDPKVET
ncbi:hypothetical protein MCEMSHM24_02418 [Comamonadaceae bacterium]